MSDNKLIRMIERMDPHLRSGKLMFLGGDSSCIKSLKRRGNYFTKNKDKIIQALSEIAKIVKEKNTLKS